MSNEEDRIELTKGEVLEEARKFYGYQQTEVAKNTGISKQSLSSYENNKNVNMSIDKGNKLSDLYKIPLDVITGKTKITSSELAKILHNSSVEELADSKDETTNLDLIIQALSNNSSTLIDEFENAIDRYAIIDFVCTDYPQMHMSFKQHDLVCKFIWFISSILTVHRRNQDAIYQGIIDFRDSLRNYSAFLGLIMGNDVKEIICDPFIDKESALNQAVAHRRNLDSIYSDITNGGTLFIT